MRAVPAPARAIRFNPGLVPQIEWSHPLTRRLLSAVVVVNGAVIDLVTGLKLTPAAAGLFTTTPSGVALKGLAASQGASVPTPPSLKATGDVSLFWFGQIQGAYSGNSTFIGVEHNNSDTAPFTAFEMATLSATANSIAFNYNNGGTFSSEEWNSGSTLPASGIHDICMVAAAGATTKLYIDAIDKGPPPVTNAGGGYAGTQTYSSTSVVNFGAYTAVPSRFLGACSTLGFIWNRALSASEVALLHENPLRFLLYPRRRRVFAVLSGVAVKADAGGYFEILAGLRRESTLSVEIAATAKAESLVPAEGVTFARGETSPGGESGTGLARGTAAPGEALATARADAAAASEWAGATGVTISATLPLELAAQARADALGYSEVAALFRSERGATAELAALLSRAEDGSQEWLVTLRRDGAAPPTWSTSAAGDGLAPLSVLGLALLAPSLVAAASPLRFIARAAPDRAIALAPPLAYVATAGANAMPAVRDLPPIDATRQAVTVAFDFGPLLPPGVTLTGVPVVTIAVHAGSAGSDPTPAARLFGPPVIGTAPAPQGSGVANGAVLQQIGNAVGGVTYLLWCSCPTTGGDTVSLWTHTQCNTPA